MDALAFSPDGLLLATATVAQALTLWDARTGKEVRTLNRPVPKTWYGFPDGQRIVSLAFAPDGLTLASAGDIMKLDSVAGVEVKLWDLRSGDLRQSFILNTVRADINKAAQRYFGNAELPEDSLSGIASFLRLFANLFWSETNSGPGSCLHIRGASLKSVAFLAGGKKLMAAFRLCNQSPCGGEIMEVDARTGNLKREWPRYEDMYSAALSPDCLTIAIGRDRRIELRNVITAQLRCTLQHSRVYGPVGALAFSPDGSTIASGYGHELMRFPGNPAGWPEYFESVQSVHLWDQKGTYFKRLSVQQPGTVTAVAFSPDGNHLAIGNAVRNFRVYRIG